MNDTIDHQKIELEDYIDFHTREFILNNNGKRPLNDTVIDWEGRWWVNRNNAPQCNIISPERRKELREREASKARIEYERAQLLRTPPTAVASYKLATHIDTNSVTDSNYLLRTPPTETTPVEATVQSQNSSKRVRNYCFTWFNAAEIDEPSAWKLHVEAAFDSSTKYGVAGKEICPTSGRKHLQGFIMLHNAMTFTAVVKKWPSIHWAPCNGTPDQNIAYCTKDNDWTEWGSRPRGQGARTDITAVRDLVKAGTTMRDICEVATSMQSIRVAEKLKVYMEPCRTERPKVYWFFGRTGTGKSHAAKQLAQSLGQDYWISDGNLRWWEGYDSHKFVILDDFRGSFCTFSWLLRLLDENPVRVEVKGGSRQLTATTMVITSCHPPWSVYKGVGNAEREDVDQLLRRISEVREFTKNGDSYTSALHTGRRGNSSPFDPTAGSFNLFINNINNLMAAQYPNLGSATL